MLTYIIRRILLIVPTLIGITAIVFFVMALAPGGVGGFMLDEMEQLDTEAGRQMAEYYRERYGLDDPLIVQYGRWLNHVSPIGFQWADGANELPILGMTWETADAEQPHGYFGLKWPDLGESMHSREPVVDRIAAALPITILINVLSIPVIYLIGVSTGIFAARFQGQTFDVASGTVLLALYAVPVIWAAVMLVGYLANREWFYLFPTSGLHSLDADRMLFLPTWDAEQGFQRGWLLDMLWHLVLPVICLSYQGFAFLSKLTRGSLLENLHSDFVRTARAKGVGERDILFRHVFRNSLLALITVAAAIIPALLSGSVVIEKIFSIPGMGREAVDAVLNRDREMILALTLLAGLVGLAAELIRDVCYAIADPRVSYD